MTVARAAAIGALALAVAVVGYLLLGGNGTHTYYVQFQNAGQLVKDDDVQIGGRRVGSIRDIKLTADNQALIKVEVQEPYAPLHQGTKAIIRATSLSGIANRYIALTPGPDSAREFEDMAILPTDSATTIVDLDQLFNTLGPEERKDLQDVVQGFATQLDGRGEEANEAAEYFNPLLSTSRVLAQQVTEDEGALTRFIVNSSRAVTSLAERRDDISSLVGNANATARAIGSENEALARALGILPQTLRRSNTTFVNLRATLDDLDVLVAESKPATKDLARLLRELRPLVADARPTVKDLRRLVSRAGPNNDLVDATRKLPNLQRVASPAITASTRALQRVQPVLEFARPYTPDLVGWLRDFGQGAANYDANGHFARIQPIFNAFQFTDNPAGGVLTPQDPDDRFDGLQTGMLRRCPSAAIQPQPDGSNPWRDSSGNLDCDPTQVLPGP